MAESVSPVKAGRSSRAQDESPSEMDFSNDAYGWIKRAHQQSLDLQARMPDPVLAVDAHLLQHLRQIQAALQQAAADLELHIPPEKRDELIRNKKAVS